MILSLWGTRLKKGKSSDFIYSVDYRWLEKEDEEEYFDFFTSVGWSHVASEGNIHLFRAHPGTKPIYTDSDTTVAKYESSIGPIMKFVVPFVLITALVWVGAMISSGTLKATLFVLAAICSAIAFPAVWTAIATYSNKWEADGRKKLANLGKVMPFFLVFIAVILLFAGGTDTAVDILTSAIIGAIVLPTAIWAVLSFLSENRPEKGLKY
ncbi:DUF2812 domain-containing protein [Virgibacillus halophilus]|uniref:DUF2812 domain-containing protein n=1 Tax=Tigheibacillus halophilus TaxID=361280 RepID=A0ABU5C4P8_9BACI|nr:DUF2812 domain-containing protein [Virgibacillus halophilus]